MYGTNRKDLVEIIPKLCEVKGVTLIEGKVCKDHIHMYVGIPPKLSVSEFMSYLKGKSALIFFWQASWTQAEICRSAFLGKRILCCYSRKCKWRDGPTVYQGSRRERQIGRRNQIKSLPWEAASNRVVANPALAAPVLCPGGATIKLPFEMGVANFDMDSLSFCA